MPIQCVCGEYSLSDDALGQLHFADIKDFFSFCGLAYLFPNMQSQNLLHLLNSYKNSILFNATTFSMSETALFQKLSDSIVRQNKLSFFYHNKKRLVEPYKLIDYRGVWYLIGLEEAKIKSYAIEKIKSLQNLEEKFFQNEEIMQKIAKNDVSFLSDTESEIILKLDTYAKEYFLSRKILQNQQILEENKEGIILSTRSSYDEEILRLVQQWIPHIEILFPYFLQQILIERLQAYLTKQKNQTIDTTCHPS